MIKIAEIILITTPIRSVVPKPLIVPVPKSIRITAAMIVVMFESITAERALLKPESTEERTVFPFLSSSLIHAKIITFASTAIPIERIIPAIPGSVRLIWRFARMMPTIPI